MSVNPYFPSSNYETSASFPNPCVFPPSNATISFPVDEHDYGGLYRGRNREAKAWETKIDILRDRQLDDAGDLGWSVGYATAYCYRHLNRHRVGIVSAINHARKAPVGRQTPFFLFACLDKHLFGGKLHEMVHLCWKTMESSSPGVTSTPGIVAPRVSIQLNSTPFEDGAAGIDELLDVLIHQMIHAYFLVCCGAQKAGEKQDGRLADGVHFGVILSTINDITRQCRRGSLGIIFHAAQRELDNTSSSTSLGRDCTHYLSYIALDPSSSSIGLALADGQSHCMHDNRNISRAQIHNWQVEEYARSLREDSESRGEVVHNLSLSGKLKEVKRLHGPPSAKYIELIWNGKRIIAPRDKAFKNDSLKKVISKSTHREIEVPNCPVSVVHCILDFIQYGSYWKPHGTPSTLPSSNPTTGPPILLSPNHRGGDGILTHIQVCKTAKSMKFTELAKHSLNGLNNMRTASDDPTAALKELYGDSSGPATDLQNWARKFLARTDASSSAYPDVTYHRGLSNYEKILEWYGAGFQEVYHSSQLLRDDCKLVVAGLSAGFDWTAGEYPPMPAATLMPRPMVMRPRALAGICGAEPSPELYHEHVPPYISNLDERRRRMLVEPMRGHVLPRVSAGRPIPSDPFLFG